MVIPQWSLNLQTSKAKAFLQISSLTLKIQTKDPNSNEKYEREEGSEISSAPFLQPNSPF